MNWLALILLFLKELILSALRVAWLAVQPRIAIRPAIVAYPSAPARAPGARFAVIKSRTPRPYV